MDHSVIHPRKTLFLRHQKTVVTVAPRVNDAGVARLGIGKHEEFMTQKIHLKYSLFNGHRLERERLAANDKLGRLILIGDRGIHLIVKSIGAQALGKTRLVAADLAVDGIDGVIQRSAEGLGVGLAAEESSARGDGNFNIFTIAFAAECYRRVRLGCKIAVKL